MKAGVAAAQEVFGEALASASLVGAAVDPSRGDRARAPELLLIVERATVADLARLGEALRIPTKRGLRPRVLLRGELDTSRDAFALEMAELRDRHVHLEGDDLLSAVEVDAEHLRVDVERRLRGLARRLRNRALQHLGRAGRQHPDRLRQDVRDVVEAMVIVAHHALPLGGEGAPVTHHELLGALLRAAGIAPEALLELDDEIRAGGAWDPLSGVEVLLPALDSVAEWVDQLEVAP